MMVWCFKAGDSRVLGERDAGPVVAWVPVGSLLLSLLAGCSTPVTDGQGQQTTLGELVSKTRAQGQAQASRGDGPVVSQAKTDGGLEITVMSGIPKQDQLGYGSRDGERLVVSIPPTLGTAVVFPAPIAGQVSPLANVLPNYAPNSLASCMKGQCSSGEWRRDERYQVHPLTPGKSSDAWPARYGCRMVPSFVVDLDVDSMYARAMRRWRFIPPERAGAWAMGASQHWFSRWKHDRQAGTYYRLAQSVSYGGMWQEQRQVYLDMTLSREGASSTLVEVNYCIRLHADLWDTTVESHTHTQQVLTASMTEAPGRDLDYVQGPATGSRSNATLRTREWKP